MLAGMMHSCNKIIQASVLAGILHAAATHRALQAPAVLVPLGHGGQAGQGLKDVHVAGGHQRLVACQDIVELQARAVVEHLPPAVARLQARVQCVRQFQLFKRKAAYKMQCVSDFRE